VFSSNAPPFEARTSYTRFGAFALLEHGGDYSAAGRFLAAQYRNGAGPESSAASYTYGCSTTTSTADEFDPRVDFKVGPFTVRRMREEDMRPHQWAHQDLIVIGGLNGITGTGGAGKGMFIAHESAGWTRGKVPGCFYGQPVRVLIVGDEDDADSDITPRIVAAGGNPDMVRSSPTTRACH